VSALGVAAQGLGQRQRRAPLTLIVCGTLVAAVLACVLFGTSIAPHDPAQFDLTHVGQRPSTSHPFGTDQLGRDVLSRVIAGARTPVIGALAIAIGVAAVGSLIGLIAGYLGGLLETIIMRWVDLMISLPGLLVAIVVVSVLGGSYWFAVALLVFFFSPFEVRMVRGLTLDQRTRAYVEAARASGLPTWRVMARHIWPNNLAIVLSDAFLNFAFALVSLSTLSFLGLGVALGTPDWGRMLFEARDVLFQNPMAAIAPALLIGLTAASVATLGDAWFQLRTSRGRGE
jgi:peptide/nickel transport system permease protein